MRRAPRRRRALGHPGLRVVDHEVGTGPARRHPRLRVPRPVLVREAPPGHRQPRLRWAIKNPAPAGPGGGRWGDTHFAASLAAALRGLGQEVVVDRRPEFDRPTGRHDDVVLVLRGLVRHDPSPEQVSLLWVISHPDAVTRRRPAATTGWSPRRGLGGATRARDWASRSSTLLQATDPDRFHPDAAAPGSGHPVLFVGNSRGSSGRWSGTRSRPASRWASTATSGRAWSPTRSSPAGRSPTTELAAAYAGAGVVLNDHWDDMRAGGFVSNRLFDAVASGARVDHGRRGRAAGAVRRLGPGLPRPGRPGTARDARRPRRGVRRRRQPGGHRRTGPPRALLRGPRRSSSSSPTRPGASAAG